MQLLSNEIQDLRRRVFEHPLYEHIRTTEHVKVFMRSHVFCVWDFQSLLKALQRQLTCLRHPWIPTSDPLARRFVNELVLAEESDEDGHGGYASHFELYLEAMKECGANYEPIQRLLELAKIETVCLETMRQLDLPTGVADFVSTTLVVAESGQTHRICAAFALGREDIIPDIFRQLVQRLETQDPRFGRLMYYLNRHIHTDSEEHGPLSRELLARVCSNDRRLWDEAEETGCRALKARLALWDAITQDLRV